MMESHWIIILPEIILASGGLLIFCMGAFGRRGTDKSLFIPALIFLCATIFASLYIPDANPFLSRMLQSNGYTRIFMALVPSIAFLCVLFSSRYAGNKGFNNDAFYGVLLFAALGMDLAARASHWLIFFLGLELLSISLYILIAIRRDDPFNGEAGIKYLITGAVAGAFLVFGIALWYAGTGSLSLVFDPASKSVDISLVMAALTLILVGIGFKISMAPFHLWTPDVYQGSPAPVTAFLATGSKVAVFAFLIRLCLVLQPPLWEAFKSILWITAFLTLVAGTVTALSQSRIKRLLAYSSVAQMGFLIMTLLAVKTDGGSFALAFYLVVYAAMDLGAFGIIASLSNGKEDRDTLEAYEGLGYTQPWSSAVLTLCLLSLAGLPPTAGFVGKVVIFKAVLQAGEVFLALVAILMSVLSIYLYMKVVVVLYMKPAAATTPITTLGIFEQAGAGIIFLFLLWAGIAPSPLLTLIGRLGIS
jgi:NADH-quinone oxidoreductase subunit N